MSIAFTLCSINYLSQAKGLELSLKQNAPDCELIIGVVDKNVNNVDLSFINSRIVYVEDIHIFGFDNMVQQYTIVELLTSVKPFYFRWLMKQYPEEKVFFYFDPDIMIFNKMDYLYRQLQSYDIILTPHMTAPIEDELLPTELHIKQTGIFNLGFLALKNTENVANMLLWWSDRLASQCYNELSRGLFVDQLWMDLVPAYFDRVLIDKNPGLNMAHWNLHERHIQVKEGNYFVNETYPLIFFHFSHYSPMHPESIAAFHTRFSFASRTDLVPLYQLYRDNLLKYNWTDLKKIKCYYINNQRQKLRKRELINLGRTLLPTSIKGLFKKYLKK